VTPDIELHLLKWLENGSSVSDQAINTLRSFVRANFDEDERLRLRAAVREFAVSTRWNASGQRAPDWRTQQSRHKKIAGRLIKAGELLSDAANLVDEERALGGPMDTSLYVRFAGDPAVSLRTLAQDLAKMADVASRKPPHFRKKRGPGRPINPHLNRLIVTVAKICIDASGHLYAKPRKRWNACNQNRANSLAEGLVALLAELPSDVADIRSASALAEYIHEHRLLAGLKSGQKSGAATNRSR
jgi:hypothetical protein